MREYAGKLIELCEEGVLNWETLAREALARLSEDEAEEICEIFDLDYED